MDIFMSLTEVPSTAWAMAAMDAIELNNAAGAAMLAGRYDEAIRLHSEALQIKIRIHGERSFHTAISLNNLGETYFKAGKLDEAADAFAKALVVRDDTAFGGMELGTRQDAAASRDNMARVLEARGDFPGAREMRLKGADKGHTMCGCEDVSLAFSVISAATAGHGFCESSAKCYLLANYSVFSPGAPCCLAQS